MNIGFHNSRLVKFHTGAYMVQRHIKKSNERHHLHIKETISLTVEYPGYKSFFLFMKLSPGDVPAKFLLFSISRQLLRSISFITTISIRRLLLFSCFQVCYMPRLLITCIACRLSRATRINLCTAICTRL